MKKIISISNIIIIILTILLIIITSMYLQLQHAEKNNLQNMLEISEKNEKAEKKIKELEEKLEQFSNNNNNNNLNLIEYQKNMPPDNLNVDRTNPKEVLNRVFDFYSLYGNGVPLLVLEYRGLNFYYDSDEAYKNIQDSDQTITLNSEYKSELFKTNITFKAFKDALLVYISEELFEELFSTYFKNIDGILYTINDGSCGRSYTISDMNKISEDANIVTFQVITNYVAGENPSEEKNFLVEFEKDDYGFYKVKHLEILN